MLLAYLFLHIVPHAEDAVNSVQEGNLKMSNQKTRYDPHCVTQCSQQEC